MIGVMKLPVNERDTSRKSGLAAMASMIVMFFHLAWCSRCV